MRPPARVLPTVGTSSYRGACLRFPSAIPEGGRSRMAVAKMLISPDIKDKLGDDGVSEVSGWLWPRDCQTCGRKLGARPPALCVDDVITFALASLHHQQCRAPAWAPGLAGLPPGDMITHGTRLMLLPTDGK